MPVSADEDSPLFPPVDVLPPPPHAIRVADMHNAIAPHNAFLINLLFIFYSCKL